MLFEDTDIKTKDPHALFSKLAQYHVDVCNYADKLRTIDRLHNKDLSSTGMYNRIYQRGMNMATARSIARLKLEQLVLNIKSCSIDRELIHDVALLAGYITRVDGEWCLDSSVERLDYILKVAGRDIKILYGVYGECEKWILSQ